MKKETLKRKFPLYKLQMIVPPLLAWYEQNKRDFAWRQEINPYGVWVSEIMLQQTRIAAVIPYYERFMARFPTVQDLAEAEDDVLLKLWEGLGYYRRAHHLKKAAQMVVERFHGCFPTHFEDLLQLPGVGRYTAGAIASICGREPVPAVDGNVLRVLCRYLNQKVNLLDPLCKSVVEEQLASIIPLDRPGTFNEALMELGEVICLPNGKVPCEQCPLCDTCEANQMHTQEQLPIRQKKAERRTEMYTIFVFHCGTKTALVRRQEKGLLANMWGLPMVKGHLTREEVEKRFGKESFVQELGDYKHIFSHCEWHMTGYSILLKEADSAYEWVTKEQLLKDYPVPTAFSYYIKQIKK